MRNIMDHIASTRPEIYLHTEYNIIEISMKLSYLQKENTKLMDSIGSHASKVTFINKSIFEWTDVEERDCFIIAMEVIVPNSFLIFNLRTTFHMTW